VLYQNDLPAGATRPLVSVVDDDESVRESLPDLLMELGFAAKAFSSAEEFLASDCVGRTRCLLLDIVMPGMSGPELQSELQRRRESMPIIFITSQMDENVRSRLLERGAVDCLFKPFSETALRDALDAALRTTELRFAAAFGSGDVLDGGLGEGEIRVVKDGGRGRG
jgi:FixJ family two-component response regulator